MAIFYIFANWATINVRTSDMQEYLKTTFKNGLRVIMVPAKSALSATVLVLVGAGSKYESKKENGLSHFLEHMFFKGTKKRPSTLKIAEALDRVGGAYNAFTSKEITGYWAKVAKEHLDLALDWVSDIFLNSKIESKELEKEKGVILEEINMRLDTPMIYIEDLWEELLYREQPAGWPTIGSRENILRFKRRDFSEYLKNHYSALNTIVCLAGSFNQKAALEKIKKHFKTVNPASPQQKIAVQEKQTKPQCLVKFKKTDQTHLILGFRGYNLFAEEVYPQAVLSAILGGSMSSRLFIEVREKRGLAYYISSSSETYTDTGYLACRAGVRNDKTGQAVQLILKECADLRDKGISNKELKKAKDYLKGSLLLGLEPSDVRASFYAGQEVLQSRILTAKEKCEKINKVSRGDVKNLAKEIFQSAKLNLAIIGPHKTDFQGLLKI